MKKQKELLEEEHDKNVEKWELKAEAQEKKQKEK